MGVLKVIRSTKVVCINSKVFELNITPNAFRLYCQVLYEAEKRQEDEVYEIDFLGCGIDDDGVKIAYQELFNLGLLECLEGIVTVVDLSPTKLDSPFVVQKKVEPPQEEFVYVIHAVDLNLYKIGCTNNVTRRYKELRHQQIPSDLGLVASYKIENAAKVENYLHNFFAEKEAHSEWFRLNRNDLSLIDSKLKSMGGIREPN